MSKPLPKIYLGCALTQAPEDFKAKVEDLKNSLRANYEIFDFIGLEKGTPTDVYRWDIHRCVAECDLFVAICDYPAIGLGYELGVAVERLHKPVLALAHTDTRVTRLLVGIDAPGFSLERYQGFSDIPKLIHAKASELTSVKDNS